MPGGSSRFSGAVAGMTDKQVNARRGACQVIPRVARNDGKVVEREKKRMRSCPSWVGMTEKGMHGDAVR